MIHHPCENGVLHLNWCGLSRSGAVDGQDALEKAETHDIHLVWQIRTCLAWMGLGLQRKLREHPKFKTIPILILTTESSDQMKQAGRSAGATGWLVKPFDPNRLVRSFRR